ncbi:MAG: peptide-methionine (S)-S-oxide reductase MsrA [Paracoccaceae bacterium]
MAKFFSVLGQVLFVCAICGHDSIASERLYVAGGCFWCVEADFESISGVIEVRSGFSGGSTKNPNYKDVRKGVTGHKESVEIEFDPLQVSIEELLYKFLRSIDVTDGQGQFCDRGDSYTTAIFPRNKEQKRAAEKAVKDASKTLGKPIETQILSFTGFYPAEAYHQDYYKSKKLVFTRYGPQKKVNAYKLYRKTCGGDTRLKDLWGRDAFFKQNEG